MQNEFLDILFEYLKQPVAIEKFQEHNGVIAVQDILADEAWPDNKYSALNKIITHLSVSPRLQLDMIGIGMISSLAKVMYLNKSEARKYALKSLASISRKNGTQIIA